VKTFRVRTLYKKSVNVYEEWRHPERKDVINIMENWRWGYWDVTPVDKEEEDYLSRCLSEENRERYENGESWVCFDPDEFEDCELWEYEDQCARDINFVNTTLTEEEQEKFEEETDYFDFGELEERGWYMVESSLDIDCPIYLEKTI